MVGTRIRRGVGLDSKEDESGEPSKQKDAQSAEKPLKEEHGLQQDDRVEVTYNGELCYGVITKVSRKGTYNIMYDDGDRAWDVPPELVRPYAAHRRSERVRSGPPARYRDSYDSQDELFLSNQPPRQHLSPRRKRSKRFRSVSPPASEKSDKDSHRSSQVHRNKIDLSVQEGNLLKSPTPGAASSSRRSRRHEEREADIEPKELEEEKEQNNQIDRAEGPRRGRHSSRRQNDNQAQNHEESYTLKREALDNLHEKGAVAVQSSSKHSRRSSRLHNNEEGDFLDQVTTERGQQSQQDQMSPCSETNELHEEKHNGFDHEEEIERQEQQAKLSRELYQLQRSRLKDGVKAIVADTTSSRLRDRTKIPKRTLLTYRRPEEERESSGSSNEEDGEEEEEGKEGGRTYQLRDRKTITRPITNMHEEPHYRRQRGAAFSSFARRAEQEHDANAKRKHRRFAHTNDSGGSRSRRRPLHSGRVHYDSSSESSPHSSSSDNRSTKSRGGRGANDEERNFQEYRERQWAGELATIQPINSSGGGRGGAGRGMGGSTLDHAGRRELAKADANPIEIDRTVNWSNLGGLKRHVQALKEMVLLPLLYPEVFTQFDVTAPRGILFYGPPGTGKTLTARALANACSVGGQHISFFMRKGADCLSKWVGEAERQLRLLFEQARAQQPSIIFFDEIDGLAPVRSSKQDQIHASIVSTLLALMDGLDSRGQVLVVGATNRPDSIDPALRRPGRFDRELCFSLPSNKARCQILDIHTRKWEPRPSKELRQEIAAQTVGYCGADLKALCAEAAIRALRRKYPQVYESEHKLLIEPETIRVLQRDFATAMKNITPAAHRSALNYGSPLPSSLEPLLKRHLLAILEAIKLQFPVLDEGLETDSESENEDDLISEILADEDKIDTPDSGRFMQMLQTSSAMHRPRILLTGLSGQGQSQLASALLHKLEKLQTFSLDLPSLVSNVNASSPEQALTMRFSEGRRHSPCLMYIPNITQWWQNASQLLRSTLLMLIQDLPDSLPVLILATNEEVKSNNECMFPNSESADSPAELESAILGEVRIPSEGLSLERAVALEGEYRLQNPTENEREHFFKVLLDEILVAIERAKSQDATPSKGKKRPLEPLPLAQVPNKPELPVNEAQVQREKDDHCLRELRIFMRAVLHELRKEKKYACFARPVDVEEVKDYYDVIKNPMDLEQMREKVDENEYQTIAQFLDDIDLIRRNAEEYNPRSEKDVRGRHIVHAAYNMKDTVESMIHRFKKKVGYDLLGRCEEIVARRAKGQNTSAPKQGFSAASVAPARKTLSWGGHATATNTANSKQSSAAAASTAVDPYRQPIPHDTALSRAERAMRRNKDGDAPLALPNTSHKKSHKKTPSQDASQTAECPNPTDEVSLHEEIDEQAQNTTKEDTAFLSNEIPAHDALESTERKTDEPVADDGQNESQNDSIIPTTAQVTAMTQDPLFEDFLVPEVDTSENQSALPETDGNQEHILQSQAKKNQDESSDAHLKAKEEVVLESTTQREKQNPLEVLGMTSLKIARGISDSNSPWPAESQDWLEEMKSVAEGKTSHKEDKDFRDSLQVSQSTEPQHEDLTASLQILLAKKTNGWTVQQLIGLRSFILKTVGTIQQEGTAEILQKLGDLAGCLRQV